VTARRDALEAAGLYDERAGRHVEDMLLWLRLRRLGKLANLPEPLYRYRFRAGSLSRLSSEAGRQKAEVIRRYAATLELAPDDVRAVESLTGEPSPRRRRAAYELDLGKLYLDRARDTAAARRHLRRAVAAAPGSPRAWFNLALSVAPRPVRDRRVAARNRRLELREVAG
jgi:hypothetical protein